MYKDPEELEDEIDYDLVAQELADERAAAPRMIVTGLLWLLFAIAIPVVTYAAAVAGGGGRYLISIGPFVIGVRRLLNGLAARG
jgi:hypothetical protein